MANHLFADEPHDPTLNYLVIIEGCNPEPWGEDWTPVSGPITCNEALDRTTELHKKWHRLRFTRINN